MNAIELPPCPWCRSSKHVQLSGENAKAMHCRGCHRSYEAEDDGEIGRGSPERNAMRREEFQIRQRTRRVRRAS